MKDQVEDKQGSIESLAAEISAVSADNSQKDIEIGALQEKIEGLEETVAQCERAERKMREEVEDIKDRAELNEK